MYKKDHWEVVKILASEAPKRVKLNAKQISEESAFSRKKSPERSVRNAFRMLRKNEHVEIAERGVYRLTSSGMSFYKKGVKSGFDPSPAKRKATKKAAPKAAPKAVKKAAPKAVKKAVKKAAPKKAAPKAASKKAAPKAAKKAAPKAVKKAAPKKAAPKAVKRATPRAVKKAAPKAKVVAAKDVLKLRRPSRDKGQKKVTKASGTTLSF